MPKLVGQINNLISLNLAAERLRINASSADRQSYQTLYPRYFSSPQSDDSNRLHRAPNRRQLEALMHHQNVNIRLGKQSPADRIDPL